MINKIKIVTKNSIDKGKNLFTRFKIAKTYLEGVGAEIGAGNDPFFDRKETIYFDKYILKNSPKNSKIAEASKLPIESEYLNYLISAHCLEHCPNTLEVLKEWNRVLKIGGIFILILPHGKRTFDKGRELNNLDHHIDDYLKKISYEHKTHVEDFKKISLKNCKDKWIDDVKNYEGEIDSDMLVKNGLVHYHVWTQNEMLVIVQFSGFEILYCSDKMPGRDDSFIIIAKKKKKFNG